MTTPTRFYLEQQILDCWRVTDDMWATVDAMIKDGKIL